ncbi:hypothetical protein ABFT80_06550 [Mesorhizobium sp. SB112]
MTDRLQPATMAGRRSTIRQITAPADASTASTGMPRRIANSRLMNISGLGCRADG